MRDAMIIYCQRCFKWYKQGLMRCCVVHPPGDCCHVGDQLLDNIKPFFKEPAHYY